ncbi:MAG: hypothetical protein ACRD0I_00235 [Acidimicrobiales bacterium]
MTAEVTNIQDRLSAIAEELADLAMARLRQSIAAGHDKRPLDEKKFTQARRAVEKANSLLDQVDRGATDPD